MLKKNLWTCSLSDCESVTFFLPLEINKQKQPPTLTSGVRVAALTELIKFTYPVMWKTVM